MTEKPRADAQWEKFIHDLKERIPRNAEHPELGLIEDLESIRECPPVYKEGVMDNGLEWPTLEIRTRNFDRVNTYIEVLTEETNSTITLRLRPWDDYLSCGIAFRPAHIKHTDNAALKEWWEKLIDKLCECLAKPTTPAPVSIDVKVDNTPNSIQAVIDQWTKDVNKSSGTDVKTMPLKDLVRSLEEDGANTVLPDGVDPETAIIDLDSVTIERMENIPFDQKE